MQIEILDRRNLSAAEARPIAELLCTVWRKPGMTIDSRTAEMCDRWRAYQGPEAQYPRSFVVRSAGRVIAHAEVFPRTIGTSFGEMTIAALAGVCTDPGVRGRGLGTQLVRAVFNLVDDGTFPVVLFQNYADKLSFYAKLRARAVDNRFVNSLATDPQLNPFWADVTMIYPSDIDWPSGEIDLRGSGY